MILTCKRLLVDIFFTHRLSKSLAFCEFTSVNFVPWRGPQDSYIKTVEILKLLFQVLLFIRTFQYHQKRATDWKQHRKLMLGIKITHRWESPDMFELMQHKKICLTVETSTWDLLKYWDLFVTFKRRLLVRVVPNTVLLLRTLSWSSLLKGLGLTVIFWTLAFDYVKTIK